MTEGGESNKGEANGRALLKQWQVEEIRLAYANHIPFREVYEKYKEIISKRGLQHVWHYDNWKNVMPEVYTEENMNWHKTNAKSHDDGNTHLGLNNKARACSDEEVDLMRKLYSEGMNFKKIAEQLHRSPPVVRKYCLNQQCSNPSKMYAQRVKNVETNLIFDSLTQAAKWANISRYCLTKRLNTKISAGIVPSTNEPAHWISL